MPGHRLQQSRLAGAVGAEQSDDVSRWAPRSKRRGSPRSRCRRRCGCCGIRAAHPARLPRAALLMASDPGWSWASRSDPAGRTTRARGEDRIADDLGGLGAGLGAAIAILLDRVADAPQAPRCRFRAAGRNRRSCVAPASRPASPGSTGFLVWSKLANCSRRSSSAERDLGIRVEIAERRHRHGIGDIEVPVGRSQLRTGRGEIGHVAEPARLAEGDDAGMIDQRLAGSRH